MTSQPTIHLTGKNKWTSYFEDLRKMLMLDIQWELTLMRGIK